MSESIRIAMWSGPRNISTAMMRSFGARSDTAVVDEPFYAAYLAATGLDHPMRAQVLASQSNDWRQVAAMLLGPVPGGKPIFYHMLLDVGRDWMVQCRNAFLIRDPIAVLASYTAKRADVSLADIGIVQQRELFEREASRLGTAPPVVEGNDVLENPARMLSSLCAALDVPYDEAMLTWPAGRRDTDGVWAPAWYNAVEQSTVFAPKPAERAIILPDELQRIADEALQHYQELARYRLQ
jgi:hypothetical protein